MDRLNDDDDDEDTKSNISLSDFMEDKKNDKFLKKTLKKKENSLYQSE
jgi:hypothetical protein